MKKNLRKISLSVISLLVFSFSFISSAGASGVPLIMSYQGRLTDASGNLVGGSGTVYYFKFSIWDLPTGGTAVPDQLWPASAPSYSTTTVRQGVFNVNIGDTAAGYPDVLDFDFNTNKDIYLQVEVSTTTSGFQALSPRQRITSSAFSQVSGAVNGTAQSSFGTTTPFPNAIVSIQSTSTSSIPSLIRSFIGQVADLFRIEDASSSHLFSIDSSGGIFGSSTLTIGSSTTQFTVDNFGNVGVGTGAPGRKFDVFDVNTTPQFRLSQSTSTYAEFYIDAVGDLHVSSTGGNIRHDDENLWVCSNGACGADTPTTTGNIIVENAVIFNNNFKFKQIDASTTVMYDTTDSPILEFDEGQ